MKIGPKLTLSFFAVAFVSMAVIGVIAFYKGRNSLEKESFNRLTAVREMKANQIEDYFGQINDQLLTLSEDPTMIDAMKEFTAGFYSIDKDLAMTETKMIPVNASVDVYFNNEYLVRLNKNLAIPAKLKEESTDNKNGRILQHIYIADNPNPVGSKFQMDDPADGSHYSETHKKYHSVIRNYLKKFGYYDVFLVDTEGNIVYTCFKEVDFGTSLVSGPFITTNLAESFRAANLSANKNFVKLVDFLPYPPSYNAPASFISTPMYDGDKKIGVLIFQMPIDRINDIMTNKREWSQVGLGKTGESYIVGDDFTLRNQSRFLIEDSADYFKMIKEIGMKDATVERIRSFNSSIGLQPVRTEGTKAALEGQTGAKIFPDYRGVPVLSAYKPLKIEGMHWAIMSELDESEAFENIYALRKQILIAFGLLLVFIAVFSLLISKRITKPLKELTYDAMELAKGNFKVEISSGRKDEIGILALSFRKMQISIGNLIEELKHINLNLEQKVTERTEEINQQKELVEHQNKEILDSINYALRLQKAILPDKEHIEKALKESFVLFKPKDIVSGDFYWINEKPEEVLIAAVDCTGHGVPGALVSMVGSNNLDRCVGEFALRKPSDILDKLKELVVATFESNDDEVKDGMDISLIALIPESARGNKSILQYSGANNPLWIIRKGTLPPAPGEDVTIFEIKADKQPIGKFDYGKPFTNHEVEVEKGDCIYIFTDGYADQFGGPLGKKFRYKTLKNLLLQIYELPMHEQRNILDETFVKWKGQLSQIDDVCVIGIRV
ncbi:MAG: SpoIIE family protein phosphatase [Bacteroidota bacterium]|nr:SpoIIE family protein phosphatase [Bacteroidota bacterium]